MELESIIAPFDELGLGEPLARLLEGRGSVRDAYLILRDAPTPLLGWAAGRLARSMHGWRVSYIVNMILNFTNICIIGCRFCAFHAKPGDPKGYLMSIEEAVRAVREAWELYNIRQVLIQGGVNPEVTVEYIEELFRRVKEATRGEVAIHGLSAVEIHHLARRSRVSIRELLLRLREAGLDSIPGGGAEILSNRCRRILSPAKLTTEEYLSVLAEAMKLGIPVSATMVYGHIESLWERAKHLLAVRRLQEEHGRVLAFIAWSYKPGGEMREQLPRSAGGSEHLRMIAASRLILARSVPHVQAGWLTAGVRVAQAALHYGASDWGGTLYGEKVLPAAGVPLPRLVRSRVEELIRGAGFEPYERDNWYRPINLGEVKT